MNNSTKKLAAQSLRAHKQGYDDARSVVDRYSKTDQQQQLKKRIVDTHKKLKLTLLGGLEEVGEKNMAILEYQNEAIIIDCGNNLGVDLPGINYAINDMSYLETIKHKLKAYVITHGHLDHIGGLRHTVPKYPAPIYGSRYTVSVIKKTFQDELVNTNFQPELVVVNIDNHEKLRIGNFTLEFIRVTHSIPDPAAICIETPVGKIVATGDFRLDPEPLDNLHTDTTRLAQLGNQGVLLLLSDSSYADTPGRTPTEHTLQESFSDIIASASGRIFVAVFSSNINRIQMIIAAAIHSGRKVALEGRSMLGYAEIAVKQGVLKIPKGMIIPMNQSANIPASQLLVICTGGQGEPNAALRRMSEGRHKYINLQRDDTVIISSSPIPGNEIPYDQLSNQLSRTGAHLFRHPTHNLDGCGPLHVSGHAKRDELREMIALVRPRFFVPVHAGRLRRTYHAELAIQEGIPRNNVLLPDNGDSLYLASNSLDIGDPAPHGSLLVDQTGAVVNDIVVKDRLILGKQGIITVVLNVDMVAGRLLGSPDIISRGFIAIKDNQQLMQVFRTELRRTTLQRFKQATLERFKTETRELIIRLAYEFTGQSPIVIPVVNGVNDVSN